MSRRRSLIATAAVVCAAAALWALRQPSARPSAARPSFTAAVSQARPPLSFERNDGQAPLPTRFLARPRGATVLITAAGATLGFPGAAMSDELPPRAGTAGSRQAPPPTPLTMRVLGADPSAEPVGVGELPGRTHYYLGSDPAAWHTGVRSYQQVRVPAIYRGIDLVYHADEASLEYDFAVEPDVDPGVIRIGFEGIERLHAGAEGDLVLTVAGGRELRHRRPRAWEEESGGRRREVAVAYAIRGEREVGFHVQGRDPRRRLVIDPTIVYATYVSGSGEQFPGGLARDSSGNVILCGYTSSTDFLGAGTRPGGRGFNDAFVMKLNPAGTTVLYSVYVGGSADDYASRVVVDAEGNAFVAGQSESNNFPGVPPRTSTRTDSDAVVFALSASGALLGARQLGGSSWDAARSIDFAGSSSLYLVGETSSNDFPGAAARTPTRTDMDGFLVELARSGFASSLSLTLGGSGYDTAEAVVGGASAYVTGFAASNDFPGVPARAGARTDFDAYLAIVGGSPKSITSVAQFGGTSDDQPKALVRDASGVTYLAGQTRSNDLPGATPRPASRLDWDAFVTKISSLDPKTVVASAYLGGSLQEEGSGLVEQGGLLYVLGATSSTDFPGAPLRAVFGYDAFVARLSTDLTGLRSMTIGGSSDSDDGRSNLLIDANGVLYAAGSTASPEFPVTPGALQPTSLTAGYAVWFARISFAPRVTGIAPATGPVTGGTLVTLSGSDLGLVTAVTFDGLPASDVTIVSDSTLTARTPAHAAGSVDVVASGPPGQTGALAAGFSYSGAGEPAPTIASLDPTVGPVAGGTTVTVHGSAFQNGATVSFGGVAATSVAVGSATSLTAVTPPHAAGAVEVVVRNPDGQTAAVAGGFTYQAALPAPTIAAIAPNAGALGGGYPVDITGTGFQTGATVTFGGTASAQVEVSSAERLTAVVPAHSPGAVDVTVVNPDGQSATEAKGFTYLSSATAVTGGCGCGHGGGGGLLEALGLVAAGAAARWSASRGGSRMRSRRPFGLPGGA